MKINIICPLYNAENYIEALHNNVLKQVLSYEYDIRYVMTEGTDQTESILKRIQALYTKIQPSEFSHGLTREKAAMQSNGDIVVFITQDIIIQRNDWLEKLVTPIINHECAATFSRQLCDNKSIEKYTRLKNYPSESRMMSKKDIPQYGLNTFFFSDASSAIDLHVFKKLNGYDGKNLPTNEDMYFAYKLIMNEYKIKYCADSEVIHSHDFKFKELYDRYYLTGKFFKQNSYLDQYGTNSSGLKMAVYIFKSAICELNGHALIQFFPNMLARYIGMRNGKKDG